MLLMIADTLVDGDGDEAIEGNGDDVSDDDLRDEDDKGRNSV